MDSKFKDIPIRDKLIVLGFIKKIILNIPKEIINIILLFYYIDFEFYKEKYGKELTFIDNKTVKMIEENWKSSTCLFGEPVTNEMCIINIIYI